MNLMKKKLNKNKNKNTENVTHTHTCGEKGGEFGLILDE